MTLRRALVLVVSLMLTVSVLTAQGSYGAEPSSKSSAVAAPTVKVARLSSGGYKVSWSKVSGATSYRIDREVPVRRAMSKDGYWGPDRGWSYIKSVGSGARSITVGDYYEPEMAVYGYSPAFRVRPVAKGRSFSSRAARAGCASGYFVAARGSNENTDKTGYSKGLGTYGEKVTRLFRERIGMKRSTFQTNAIDYPARNVVSFSGAANYGASKNAGRDAFIDEINTLTKQCPKAKVFTFGFSQGAHALGDSYNRLSFYAQVRLTHVVLFADPARSETDGGIKYYPSNPRAGNPIAGQRAKFFEPLKGQISTWCWSGDTVCTGGTNPHGSAYACYTEWVARLLAQRAKDVGWKPKASTSSPSCRMKI